MQMLCTLRRWLRGLEPRARAHLERGWLARYQPWLEQRALFRFQRQAQKWAPLLPQGTPIGRCSLQSYAWGVSLREEGEQQRLLLACDEGATEVRVDPLDGRYTLDRCPGRAIAAPTARPGASRSPPPLR